jgi:hypothetical protein
MDNFIRSTLDQIAAEVARLEGEHIDADDGRRERIAADLVALHRTRRALTAGERGPSVWDRLPQDEVDEAILAGRVDDLLPRKMPASRRFRRRRGDR